MALLLAFASAGASATPVTYQVDPSHTYPSFGYIHYGYSAQVGRFNQTSGEITLDRAAKIGSMTVTVDTTSVDTGNKLFNQIIQEGNFFDTAKYPKMTFTSNRIAFNGDKPTEVEGTLQIKGISKPLTLMVTSFNCGMHPMVHREACGANAMGTVKRSDFGMQQFSPDVSDEVTIWIAVEAIREMAH